MLSLNVAIGSEKLDQIEFVFFLLIFNEGVVNSYSVVPKCIFNSSVYLLVYVPTKFRFIH